MPDFTPTNVSPRSENNLIGSPQKDKWTLMFLIAGDASLSASMISQLKELTDAGFQRDTNVLLYFDPNCNGRGARIYDVNRYRKQNSRTGTDIGDGENPFVRTINEDCNIQSLQQIPAMTSLRYFLEYSRFYYPAENYMLFLMGHGVIVGNDQFLPDTDDGSSVTLKELGKILKNFGLKVRKTGDEFHLVGFHSCGMSSVELAFELQDSARYMLGTQGSAFPGSWPYRQLLKKIFNVIDRPGGDLTPTSSEYPNQVVRNILEALQKLSFYNAQDFWHAGFSADLSMCSLDKGSVESLKPALQDLVAELKKGLKNGARNSILLAHLESQSYFGESYTDLYDFCECLQKHCPEGGPQDGIGKACAKVRSELESERCDQVKTDPDGLFKNLVVFSDYYGPAYQHSNGLSIFFPWRAPVEKVMTSYEHYEFTKEMGSNSWMSFLDDYFFSTRRPLKGKTEPTEESSDKIATPAPRRARMDFSDAELLRLGPPPRSRSGLTKRIALLVNELETMAKKTGTLAETSKETGTVAKEMGTLAEKLGTLAKEMGTLAESGKELGTLAKEMGTLEKEMATLSKETATLSLTAKETGSLSKETATLAKETATLAKETGTLATVSKETATLGETGQPLKETGSLSKETATLGLFGNTIIKNFDAPEGEPITSRPKGKPNWDRKDSGDAAAEAKAGGRY